jgi:eukaryotic-like serine/threonine-protein kinase
MQQCPHCAEPLEFTRTPPRFCPNCGKALRPLAGDATQPYTPPTTAPVLQLAEPVALPESVGGYRLLRPIGEGGMGSVFEGEEIASGRRVAVKLIRAEYADSPDAVERFRREGQLAGTIAHPRCVFVFAADEEAGRPYLVMELMSGVTLANFVERNGPLKPREAVVQILDVIAGLQEAHRCGVLHRDVKPSNCFVDSDGRVKVGDFGLSKALKTDARLTQSGAFLGTLLYAAPEQIRNDRVDHQADVYSVAATLYFLLTGRAPFQGEDTDAAAALARTLTDPPTPIRKLRNDVPTTLEVVVLRGLERLRERRWQNLEEFRLALLPFVRDQRSWSLFGWRIGAYLLDVCLIAAVVTLLRIGNEVLHAQGVVTAGLWEAAEMGLFASLPVVYFFVTEWLFGGSPGKLLCHLRLRTALRNDRPGFVRTLVRTMIWFVLYNGPSWAVLGAAYGMTHIVPGTADDRYIMVGLLGLCSWPFTLAGGVLLLGCTMRPGNGFRALHDFLTSTMVIRLPSARVPRLLVGFVAPPEPTPMPGTVPTRLGTFEVLGLLCANKDDQLLLGEDGGLHRRVWLWARPRAAAELTSARRDLNRTTRPRWLASGREGGRRWDAFIFSPGCLLIDIRPGGQRFAWAEIMPVLGALADELTAACADGTLPHLLSLEQVWIDAAGRLQMLDLPLRFPEVAHDASEPQHRALALLRQVAVRTLEGTTRAPDEVGPIHAPLPDHAAILMRRLLAGQGAPASRGFATVREVRAALRAARDVPGEITRRRRALHLATLAPLLGGWLLWLLAASFTLTVVKYEAVFRAEAHAEEALATAAARNADRTTRQRLENKRDRLRQRREHMLDSHLGFMRPLVTEQAGSSPLYPTTPNADAPPDDWHERLDRLEATLDDELANKRDFWVTWFCALPVPVLIGALVWSLWVGITRGGMGQWVAGVRLVQGDGHWAARWRCTWRAVLVCLPIALLLSLSLGAEGLRLMGEPLAGAFGAWFVWTTWWLGLAPIPLFWALALASPNRGIHDRLAGTYLVPR